MLTTWATAGILGQVVVKYMRECPLGLGLPREQVYNRTMFVLVGMLVVGFVCNLLIKAVDPKFFMGDEELEHEKRLALDRALTDCAVAAVSPTRPTSALAVATAPNRTEHLTNDYEYLCYCKSKLIY